MQVRSKWKNLGSSHVVWDLLRYFRSRRHTENAYWLALVKAGQFKEFPVRSGEIDLLESYLADCRADTALALDRLRDEADAVRYSESLGARVEQTRTRSTDHHQSAKALVAAVSKIAVKVSRASGMECVPNPQRRSVWFRKQQLHVTARNLDGAVPSLQNPFIVWEIKEYWGKTSGGSKMSDAVYECSLVGLELRNYEARVGCRTAHVVFLDGKSQWESRKSDMVRFIDLFHQGIIDQLFIGREVESDWEPYLKDCIDSAIKSGAAKPPI